MFYAKRKVKVLTVFFIAVFISALIPSSNIDASTPVLISVGKPTEASSFLSGHEPSYANDTDKNTYWDAPLDAHNDAWWQMDLQGTYRITSVNIRNFVDGSRYYKYYIRVSMDGIHWVPIAAKNNSNTATDAGDTYNVCALGRYIRVNIIYNSANTSVHVTDFKVYGYTKYMPPLDTASITNFIPDKNAYYAGDNAFLTYTIKNNSSSSITISKIRIRKHGLTNPLDYDETPIASNVVIGAGKSYTANNSLIWSIPMYTELGAYGFWLNLELGNGEVYDSYQSFTRIVNSSTLLKYNVGKQNYNGLNVFTLDGGMSAETAVEKSLENLESGTSHSWYVQDNGGPNHVYSSRQFFTDAIQQTVDYYNNYLGASTTFDTVIFATGNCAVNYLSRVAKAPVLPVQFLVSLNSYKELRKIVDYSNAIGIPTYSTLGCDSSMEAGVAWVKMLDLPPAYKTFIRQHNVRNIVIFATGTSAIGETMAKKAIEPNTVLNGINAGDIFVMYPNGAANIGYDIDKLTRNVKDYRELSLENSYRYMSDWESGMSQSQVDAIAQSAKNSTGADASVIHITSEDSMSLYNYAAYAVCKFYKKNEGILGSNPIQGVAINPYLIGHPAYETKIKYVPAMFWQGSYTGKQVVDDVLQGPVKNAIAAYFPNIDFKSLNFWINYSNNFGGATHAGAIKNELLYDGMINLTENDYTKDEIWNVEDGMGSPVEKIAQNIILYSSPADMKNFYSGITALNNQDFISIMQVYPGVTITAK